MRATLLSLAGLAFCAAATAASTYSPDATDLWWNPAESGWGVNLIQQHDTIFATFFIYGADGRARWYVASDMRGNGAPTDQTMIFQGILYETTAAGAVTSMPFDPAAVTRRAVGSVTFQYFRPSSGILSYTIDGVTVSKDVRRQTWGALDITGEFNLNRVLRPHLCNGQPNGPNDPITNDAGMMTVSRSGSTVQINTRPVAPSTLSCTFNGTLTQEGRMSAVSGSYICSDGTSGPFSLTEIEVSKWGFISRIATTVRGCAMHGSFGGARATVEELPS